MGLARGFLASGVTSTHPVETVRRKDLAEKTRAASFGTTLLRQAQRQEQGQDVPGVTENRAAAYGRIVDSAELTRASGSAASLLRRSDAAAGVPSVINVDDDDDDNVSDQEDADGDAAAERSSTSYMMEDCAQPDAAGRLFRSWADIIAQHDFDDIDEAEEGSRKQEQESRGDE
ncbi:hypothetical protein PsorP6_013165 [Peronosclerospora sorghi]|uniref:Uncharacterized protein n=1 Tax=Peronosclerospora sorghi TaxID=230839 RepID=A0ACC0WGD7_9STRA|nr:hypothetical protein PsorP6_013165 [Peronosclerospora sorghi]